MRSWEDLEHILKQNYQHPDLAMIKKAYDLAQEVHKDVKRLTGHDYMTHPAAVAYRLAEMGLGMNVITAGLLHDVVEDSDMQIGNLEKEFGKDVAYLVDGLTKLKKVKYKGVERYVENMRKMFLAMASDVRVVFIKFADRIHNLQTLYAMPTHKQKRVAREVLEIYAPIAGRLGMSEIKGELEDLAFKYNEPKSYDWMQNIVETRVRETGSIVTKIIDRAQQQMEESHINHVQIYGRVKRLYSLYKKMRRYENDVARINDIIAIRIIVEDVADCYAVLGILHQNWPPVPNRIKDYIAQPKPNGYQSLHTTVFCEGENTAEFQIRTQEMHELAEYGIAAHWRYKEIGKTPPKNLRWMEELVKIQKEMENKKDFLDQLETMKLDMFEDRIFVFTPNGDVIDLPENATPIDFAYAIHTEIGNKCSSARVNSKIANLDTALSSGDIVEIITDKNRKGPNPDWLKFAKTHHARTKIKEETKRSLRGWFTGMLARPSKIGNQKM